MRLQAIISNIYANFIPSFGIETRRVLEPLRLNSKLYPIESFNYRSGEPLEQMTKLELGIELASHVRDTIISSRAMKSGTFDRNCSSIGFIVGFMENDISCSSFYYWNRTRYGTISKESNSIGSAVISDERLQLEEARELYHKYYKPYEVIQLTRFLNLHGRKN